VRKGQFDDMDTPALDILHDDERDRRVPAATSRTSASHVD